MPLFFYITKVGNENIYIAKNVQHPFLVVLHIN